MKTMQCKECEHVMVYNSHYQCYECSCGKVYNAVGQELRPIEDWQDEYDDDYY